LEAGWVLLTEAYEAQGIQTTFRVWKQLHKSQEPELMTLGHNCRVQSLTQELIKTHPPTIKNEQIHQNTW